MADAIFTHHEPCPNCNSSDALARYSDGSAHCFRKCGYNERAGATPATPARTKVKEERDFLKGSVRAIENRKIKAETCEHWSYLCGEDDEGRGVHIAQYKDYRGRTIAQKLRGKKKTFRWIGDPNGMLYGQWLAQDGGKYVVITEGEIDALTVSQVFGLKYSVVSLPNGADSCEKALRAQLEWLDKFDTIVLMFDQDPPGDDATEVACGILPIGKVKIAKLPYKDANECLVQLGPVEATEVITQAFWKARAYRPDGIVNGNEITLESLRRPTAKGFTIPDSPILHEKLMGTRKGELTLWTAGSGIGKSTRVRELAYKLHQEDGLIIGNMFLEENNAKTAQGYIALHNNIPLKDIRYNPDILTAEQWERSYEAVMRERMWFYNHFGSLDSKHLLGKLRYMAVALNCDFIILDHISIVTSGIESSSEGERKDIDILMTRLRSLIEETGVGIHAVVHLKRVSGKNFNEGGQISLTDLRGSAALEQLSDNVIALERNQQDDDEDAATTSIQRVLKCRETGETGEADHLQYDRRIGRNVLATERQAAAAFSKIDTDEEALPF